jgi:uncharacterized protein YkwD
LIRLPRGATLCALDVPCPVGTRSLAGADVLIANHTIVDSHLRAAAGRVAGLTIALLLTALPAAAQVTPRGQLGPAPRVTDISALATETLPEETQAVPAVDRTSRTAVVNLYNSVYVPALEVANDWNGSVTGCNAGSTSESYASATMDMVNYFRSMTGLPSSVPHVALKDGPAQQAALMMTANGNLDHFPPPSWICYTGEGANAAGNSNLALGTAGAAAITLYIADPGSNNTALGHRRWILYPRQTEMGTGSTDDANTLWVIGQFGSRPATTATVAWPPAGFVPYQVVYPRWSFSVNTSASVSFTSASVTMTRGGSPVSLTVLPDAFGYGDSTIAWEPSGLTFPGGEPDDPVSVQVNNVFVGGVPTNYSYVVTVIDPALVGPPTFTDEVLQAHTTLVKAVHLTELRQAVDDLRGRYLLGAFTWTDPTLTAGSTPIKAAHVTELRSALDAVYDAAQRTRPAYTTSPAAGGTVRAVDVAELRSAVLAIW